MTTVRVDRESVSAGRPSLRRRRRVIVAVAVVVAVLFAGGLTTLGVLRHLDHQYGPVEGGSGYGPYADRGFVFERGTYHLSEQPGATAQLIAFLDNRGAHSIKVDSIGTGEMVREIRWSVYHVIGGGSAFGIRTPWHEFPAIIPAHGTIRLLITLQHPSNCDAYPKYHGIRDVTYNRGHLVHWESLLDTHTTFVELLGGLGQGIRVC